MAYELLLIAVRFSCGCPLGLWRCMERIAKYSILVGLLVLATACGDRKAPYGSKHFSDFGQNKTRATNFEYDLSPDKFTGPDQKYGTASNDGLLQEVRRSLQQNQKYDPQFGTQIKEVSVPKKQRDQIQVKVNVDGLSEPLKFEAKVTSSDRPEYARMAKNVRPVNNPNFKADIYCLDRNCDKVTVNLSRIQKDTQTGQEEVKGTTGFVFRSIRKPSKVFYNKQKEQELRQNRTMRRILDAYQSDEAEIEIQSSEVVDGKSSFQMNIPGIAGEKPLCIKGDLEASGGYEMGQPIDIKNCETGEAVEVDAFLNGHSHTGGYVVKVQRKSDKPLEVPSKDETSDEETSGEELEEEEVDLTEEPIPAVFITVEPPKEEATEDEPLVVVPDPVEMEQPEEEPAEDEEQPEEETPEQPTPQAPKSGYISIDLDHSLTQTILAHRGNKDLPSSDRRSLQYWLNRTLTKERNLYQRQINGMVPRWREMQPGLESSNISAEFAYITLIESSYFHAGGYVSTCNKRSSASGPWQFLTGTARSFGLKTAGKKWSGGKCLTAASDERGNLEASTAAAGRYLRLLLNMFNQDPLLAVAGYHYGQGNILKQYKGTGISWWLLSKNRAFGNKHVNHYVPKFLAYAIIGISPTQYEFEL